MSDQWREFCQLEIRVALLVFDTALGASEPLTIAMVPGRYAVRRMLGFGVDPLHYRRLRVTSGLADASRGARLGVAKTEFGQIGIMDSSEYKRLVESDDVEMIDSFSDQLTRSAAGEVRLTDGLSLAFANARVGVVVFCLGDAVDGRYGGVEIDLELFEREYLAGGGD